VFYKNEKRPVLGTKTAEVGYMTLFLLSATTGKKY